MALGTNIKESITSFVNPDIEGLTRNQQGMLKWGNRTIASAALFIGVTSILDYGHRRHNENMANKEKEQELKEQEEEMRRTNSYQSKARRDVQKKYARPNVSSYYRLDAGKTVMEMFNNRNGHHQMGNKNYSNLYWTMNDGWANR